MHFTTRTELKVFRMYVMSKVHSTNIKRDDIRTIIFDAVS